ncbi:MAG: hypothetical protein GC159_21660 [Phycisphaera sp.]|nr:hypothetical protein [Phycisphaera sp.]
MSETRVYKCPAKVNLSLSVGAPRADGMHPICSWMVQVSLYDDLIIRRGQGVTESTFDIGWAEDAPQPTPIDWPVHKDLIAKAHALMEESVGRPLPVHATLRKRTPVGGGLGGGSSDGAMMLKALDDVFGLGVPMGTMLELASKLGSDVAFFIGPPSAIVSGFGELITPMPVSGTMELTLILPPLTCNTGAVYREFDAMGEITELRDAVVGDEPFNDLAKAACVVEPRLAALRLRLHETLGVPVYITGSGAAMFTTCHVDLDKIDVPAVHVHTL